MSTDNNKTPHEPAKPAPVVVTREKPRRRSFLGWLFSHLVFAAVAVIGIGSWLHWDDILKYAGNNVCSYNMLGKYMTTPAKLPPAGLAKKTDDSKTGAVQAEKPATTPETAQPESKQTQKPVKATEPEKVPEKQTDSKTGAAPEPEKKAESQPESSDLESAWQAARKLFWTNDAKAESAYEALTEKYSDQPDILGELGNVYYKNNKITKAADAFFKAGEIYNRQNQQAKAEKMVRILQKIAPEKSRKLEEKITPPQ